LGGLAPDVEEHVAQEIFRQGLVAHDAQQPAIERHPMAGEQREHGELVAVGDPADEDVIRGNFASLRRHGGGRTRRSRSGKGNRHGYPHLSRPNRRIRNPAIGTGCDVMTPKRSIARWNGASLSRDR
jgi:hypothetical protein